MAPEYLRLELQNRFESLEIDGDDSPEDEWIKSLKRTLEKHAIGVGTWSLVKRLRCQNKYVWQELNVCQITGALGGKPRDLKGNRLFFEKPLSHISVPPNQNGTMAKDTW